MAFERNEAHIYNSDGTPNQKTLLGLLAEHKRGVKRLEKLMNYALGKHAILKRERDKVNNKVVVNHAEYISDFATSYFIGNPIMYSRPEANGNEAAERALLNSLRIANISHIDTELSRLLSIFGSAIELVYQDTNGVTKSAFLDPRSNFVVDDDTVEYRELLGVRRLERKNESNKVTGETVIVYTATNKYTYLLKNNTLKLESTEEVLYGQTPMIEYVNKPYGQGDFEGVISLIDAYNTLQSDRVNDKEQFVNALLVIYGIIAGDTTDEKIKTARELKKIGMLEMPESARAEYITKTFQEADIELLRKSIADDIHKISKVPDLTDQNFAGNSSGVAMNYKLLGLEQLAQTKEGYYRIGLMKRLQLYCKMLNIRGINIDPYDIEITFKRSLPSNTLELAQMVQTLNNTVSKETLLKQIPFIEDVPSELARIEKERQEAIKRQQAVFGAYESHVHGDGEDDEA